MVDGAFYAHKCYAQKCYYWVRDQEKIKSNELVVTAVVIDVLGIYDTKPCTHGLYLARDAFTVVTISHLPDIVGTDGNVYVAKHRADLGIGIMVELLNQRSNVHTLDGADTTNATRCKDLISSLGKTINIIYCDVGRDDQVDCLFNHASTIMERGGHFVALIKANNIVYKHNREINTIILSEMSKLEEHRFKCVEALKLGRLGPEWCCFCWCFNE